MSTNNQAVSININLIDDAINESVKHNLFIKKIIGDYINKSTITSKNLINLVKITYDLDHRKEKFKNLRNELKNNVLKNTVKSGLFDLSSTSFSNSTNATPSLDLNSSSSSSTNAPFAFDSSLSSSKKAPLFNFNSSFSSS